MTRRGGPYPHLRLNFVVKHDQGKQMYLLIHTGHSFREAAAITGLSLTTAWRRYWFFSDWQLPRSWGKPITTIPPQRGTKAHPGGGRPWIRSIDEGRWPKPE
jgi:hypothetical protein